MEVWASKVEYEFQWQKERIDVVMDDANCSLKKLDEAKIWFAFMHQWMTEAHK